MVIDDGEDVRDFLDRMLHGAQEIDYQAGLSDVQRLCNASATDDSKCWMALADPSAS